MTPWKQTAAELLKAITPEFRQVPCYIVDADALAAFYDRYGTIRHRANG